MIRVCMVGLGKTGKEIVKTILEQEDMKLVAAVCNPNSEKKGKDVGEVVGCGNLGVTVESSDCLEEIIFRTKPNVVVDFSNPQATIRNAKVFSRMKVKIVIGTTGFSKTGLMKLFILARKYQNGIVYAPNITLGVNVLMLLSHLAAGILDNYDFQITEIHHKNKKDAPSGTAIKIAKEIESGLKTAGVENPSIPISAVRAGGVVGKHEVMIVGEHDQIKITHESFSRRAFALGAMRAIRFVSTKNGYYEMNDILDLERVLNSYLKKDSTSRRRIQARYFNQDYDVPDAGDLLSQSQ